MKKRYKPRYLRQSSVLEKSWQIFTSVLVGAVFLLAVLLAGARFIGYRPFYVLSGSMTPEYNVGDLVYVKEVPPEEIQVGDVITYVFDESLTVVTHRVVDVDREEGAFITKGDANAIPDGNPVLYENVLGVAGLAIPGLGYLSSFLTTPTGQYTAIAVLLGLILVLLVPELLQEDDEEEEEEKQKKTPPKKTPPKKKTPPGKKG